MTVEGKVAVVADSGSSFMPEDPLVEELGITVVPLTVIFDIGGKAIEEYPDNQLRPEKLYQMMSASPTLPTTSGTIIGPATEAYKELSAETNEIVSIHITSEHSAAYTSALQAAEQVSSEFQSLTIQVIDSRSVSLGSWWLIELAANLAQQGHSLKEISQEVIATIPKIELLVVLSTYENVVKGGRIPAVAAQAASLLSVYPVLSISGERGRVLPVGGVKTTKQRNKRLLKAVEKAGSIVKLGVLHTNAPALAEETRELLGEVFEKDKIIIKEAGSVLGVHAGPGAVGVAFWAK